jgi:hypothetical protein
VELKQKFLSNLMVKDQFIAEIAIESEDLRDTKLKT